MFGGCSAPLKTLLPPIQRLIDVHSVGYAKLETMGNNKSKPYQPQQHADKSKTGETAPSAENQQKDSKGEKTGEEGNGQAEQQENDVLRKHMGIKDAKKASLDDFDFLKTVGRGSFGKVIQVRPK